VSRHHKIERDLAALSLEKSKLEAEYQKLLQKRIRTQEALKRKTDLEAQIEAKTKQLSKLKATLKEKQFGL
jgi:ABC-type Fe3+-citrate transport system substrate-binding protein